MDKRLKFCKALQDAMLSQSIINHPLVNFFKDGEFHEIYNELMTGYSQQAIQVIADEIAPMLEKEDPTEEKLTECILKKLIEKFDKYYKEVITTSKDDIEITREEFQEWYKQDLDDFYYVLKYVLLYVNIYTIPNRLNEMYLNDENKVKLKVIDVIQNFLEFCTLESKDDDPALDLAIVVMNRDYIKVAFICLEDENDENT